MKVYIHKTNKGYTFANEGKGGFIGSADDVETCKVKAKEMYGLYCVMANMQMCKGVGEKGGTMDDIEGKWIMPEDLEFIEV